MKRILASGSGTFCLNHTPNINHIQIQRYTEAKINCISSHELLTIFPKMLTYNEIYKLSLYTNQHTHYHKLTKANSITSNISNSSTTNFLQYIQGI